MKWTASWLFKKDLNSHNNKKIEDDITMLYDLILCETSLLRLFWLPFIAHGLPHFVREHLIVNKYYQIHSFVTITLSYFARFCWKIKWIYFITCFQFLSCFCFLSLLLKHSENQHIMLWTTNRQFNWPYFISVTIVSLSINWQQE